MCAIGAALYSAFALSDEKLRDAVARSQIVRGFAGDLDVDRKPAHRSSSCS
jgi:hypothetical protein